MAAARLRRTFRYPSEDNDNDNDPDPTAALDEEHQEQLIASLQAEDDAKTTLYRTAFLSLPVLGSLFFLSAFATASTASQRLVALLAIASLACTASILHFHPLEQPENNNKKGKTPLYKLGNGTHLTDNHLIIPLNAVLAGLVAVAAWTSWRNGRAEAAWRESLPALILALSLFARWQLAPVDLAELQRARYELKGA